MQAKTRAFNTLPPGLIHMIVSFAHCQWVWDVERTLRLEAIECNYSVERKDMWQRVDDHFAGYVVPRAEPPRFCAAAGGSTHCSYWEVTQDFKRSKGAPQ